MEHLSDKELMTAADEGSAFRELYNRYWEPLYKKALYRLGNSADAQDIVQQVFITLWRNKNTIHAGPSLAAYLSTAIKYSVIKLVYRKAKKGILVPLDVNELEIIELTTEELLQYKELQTFIDGEVAVLPERMQEVYQLSRKENLSITEIAERLQLSEQTVKNTLSIALKRIREKLSRYACWLPFFL